MSEIAEVKVFVDDAVTGSLPDVCALDGVPADGLVRVTREVGDGNRLGIAWLLLLAGPLGWVALLLIAASRHGRGEVLEVRVPISQPAHDRWLEARKLRAWCAVAGVGAGALLVLGLLVPDVAGASNLVALVALGGLGVAVAGVLVADARVQRAMVGVALDASRRWVTFSGVHPSFAVACEQERLRDQGLRHR